MSQFQILFLFLVFQSNIFGKTDQIQVDQTQVDQKIHTSLFFEACERGDLKIAQTLIGGDDVDINYQKNDQNQRRSALMMACIKGNLDILELLLKYKNTKKLDINAGDDEGGTALLHTFKAKHENKRKIIHLLLENGADVNLQNKNKETALMLEMEMDIGVFDDLIKAGADLSMKDTAGKTPLMKVLTSGTKADLVNSLLDQPIYKNNPALIAQRDSDGNTLLMIAIAHNNIPAISGLLAQPAYTNNPNFINEKDMAGHTALMIAALGNKPEVVKALLTDSIYKNNPGLLTEKDASGNTALMLAAGANTPLVVKAFLENSADVDLLGPEDKTALIIACEKSDAATIKLLLSNYADIKPIDQKDWTAFMYLAKRTKMEGQKEAIDEFLKLQADPNPILNSSDFPEETKDYIKNHLPPQKSPS